MKPSKRNVLAVYACATDAEREAGMLWYRDARDLAQSIATAHALSLDSVAGVLAALSPQVAWGDNVDGARELIATGKIRRYGGYRANLRKAERILAGEAPDDVLGGNKVRAFWRLIRDGGNAEDVVVDQHTASVADGRAYLWKQGPDLRGKHYGARVKAYLKASTALGIPPHAVQASTWLAWKRLKHEESATV